MSDETAPLAGRAQRLTAEAVGTALLLAAVVGSGIMGERLAGGSTALALLANSLATGAALVALLLVLGPVSGAHLNPVVSAVAAARGELPRRELGPYVLAQVAGALGGVLLAEAMFGEHALAASAHARGGAGQLLGEAAATFGLVSVVLFTGRQRPGAAPFAVAAWIVAASWFTSSTSFANPAATVARAFTDTFAGIRPADVGPFIAAQAVGGAAAAGFFGFVTAPARRSEGRRASASTHALTPTPPDAGARLFD